MSGQNGSTGNSGRILVLNSGSSTIKFKIFDFDTLEYTAGGVMDRIGTDHAIVKVKHREETTSVQNLPNHEIALKYLLEDEIVKHGIIGRIEDLIIVGHRVVHGGEKYHSPAIVDDDVIKGIEDYINIAPLHNPHNLAGILAIKKYFGNVAQVACFDTAFHFNMPEHAYLYAIPFTEYKRHGIRRYGFHGISHDYVSEKAAKLLSLGKKYKMITCHLGNGSSICAIKDGVSIDTSMGFTPMEGLVMGTRSGDIDPGILIHLVNRVGYTMQEVDNLLNKSSGLSGLSRVGNDFREIKKGIAAGDESCKMAFSIYCYRLKKYLCSYAGILGGIDCIVFTGGIGENAPEVRSRVLEGLEFMNVRLDPEKNDSTLAADGIISVDGSVKVMCIHTDEEYQIARESKALFQNACVERVEVRE